MIRHFKNRHREHEIPEYESKKAEFLRLEFGLGNITVKQWSYLHKKVHALIQEDKVKMLGVVTLGYL